MEDVQKIAPTESQSFFWSCLTFDDDCPFFSQSDPRLYYFGFGLLSLYTAFLIVIIFDLKFWWSLNDTQKQIDYYVELVRQKVKMVQVDQRRLISTKELTEKQLRRSNESRRIVTALRAAVSSNDPAYFNQLASKASSCTKNQPELRTLLEPVKLFKNLGSTE